MKKIKTLFLISTFLFLSFISAQQRLLNGQLIADDEVEGLHVLNRSAAKYTISTADGSFVIPARAFDTLVISGVKYQKQEFVITPSIMELGQFNVQLIENINELNEVVVGKILTGSLESDIENSDAKSEINFYDLGIPGSTDIPATQNEQRLYDADHGQFVYYYGIGLSINVHKILNRINGDTNAYKERIKIESDEDCINSLQSQYADIIFEAIPIPEQYKTDFFQFCLEDEQFNTICEDENRINDVDFLLVKLENFKIKLNEDD
ncbi:hypothetical protein [Winogradskyella forsetii]|uniref:hypothetical protein n=1 Tax=Winogradskyella forsetii TaxID=2686077 RepID=UPI0015C1C390|nr:hypothetical protein [Winogradskyella forsetii]